MSDWSVLGLPGDPTPGDPAGTSALAARLRREADRAHGDGVRLRAITAGSGDLALLGDYAPKYRDALAELPAEVGKLEKAFGGAGDALATYADQLSQAKARAGTALREGEDADARYQGAMNELRAALPGPRSALLSSGLGLTPLALDAATAGLDPGTAATVQAAAARARTAAADRDAARSLAGQAAALRGDAETRCVDGINAALDGSGIKDKSWWQKAWDRVTAPFKSWDAFISLCRTVAIIAGTVALFISGPIGLALVAIALIASAVVVQDTLTKFAQGRATLTDVSLDALGLVPGEEGAVDLARLSRCALGLARDLPSTGRAVTGLLRSGREALPAIRDVLGDLRESAIPAVKRFLKIDPIDMVTGEMVMRETDVRLPGTLPLVLTRTHASSYRAGRWFGRSWTSTLDQRLEVDGGGVLFAGEDGTLLAFPLPGEGAAVEPYEGPRLQLRRDGEHYRLLDAETGRRLTFAAAGAEPGVLPLRSIENRNGDRIDISYDVTGSPVVVRHSSGYAVGVDTCAGLVTGLRLLGDDRDGDVVLARYDYDGAGRLVAVTDASGVPLRLEYDPAGRIVGWHDRLGTSYRYGYDVRGRVVSTSGSAGCLDGALHYDEEERTTTVVDSLGAAWRYTYNEDLQVVREVDPLGAVTRYAWDRYDRLLMHEDALGAVTRHTYDDAGDLTRVTRADSATFSVSYDERHLPVVVTRPDGSVERRAYDAAGNLVAVTDPAGAVTQYAYDERGHLAGATDAAGGVTLVTSDAAGLPVAVTDPAGRTSRCSRDLAGRLTAVADPAGGITLFTWTAAGRLASRTLPSGRTERWAYDAEGNLVGHTDPDGHRTMVEYTWFDLPAAVTGPDGARRVFGYDTELRLVAVTDAAGLVWRYERDAAGRLVGEVDLDGRELRYERDPVGRLTAQVNGAGERVSYRRDALGQVICRDHDGLTDAFGYDPMGRLLRASTPDTEVGFAYDPAGRVLTETVDGRAQTSTYDAAGRRVRRETASGAVSDWTFDEASQPLGLVAGPGRLEFGHDAGGRESSMRLGEVLLTRTFDADGRLHAQRVSAGHRRLVDRVHRYRGDGSLTGIDDPLAGSVTFDLDPVGRITAASSGGSVERFAYDVAGRPLAGGRSSYEGTRIRGVGRSSYGYDGQGRMIWRRTRTLDGQRREWTYSWDALDRLVAVTTPGGDRWRYLYDALGRRVSKQCSDDEGRVVERVDYTWDGAVLAEQVRRFSGQAKVTTWDWRPGTFRPVSQTDRVGPTIGDVAEAPQSWVDEQFHAIVTDLVGTPTQLVDAEGRVAWQARTSVWGARIGDGADDVLSCPLRLPGQIADNETGLHYNYFRYYDPESGRYVSADPIGLLGGFDPHGYVLNPTTWADPLGLAPCDAAGGAPNAANGLRLAQQLTFEEAASPFTVTGGLRDDVIASSGLIIPGVDLNNPEVLAELTSDGSRIEDWGKYATPSFRWPGGKFKVHFYYNDTTRAVNYNIDYKAKFQGGGR